MTVMIRNWFIFVSVSKAEQPLVFFFLCIIHFFFSESDYGPDYRGSIVARRIFAMLSSLCYSLLFSV